MSGATPVCCWQPPRRRSRWQAVDRARGWLLSLSTFGLAGQRALRTRQPGGRAPAGPDAARRARARAASAQANAALAHVLQHPSEVQDWLEKVKLPNLVQLKNWVSAFPPASAAQPLAAPPQQGPNGQGPPNNGQGPPGQVQSFAQQQPAQAQPDAQPQAQAEQVCAQPRTSKL